MPNHLAVVGRVFLTFLATIGRLAMFTGKSVVAVATPLFYWRLCLQQMMTIGYFPLPVVGMTALFTGAVPALQIYLGPSHCDGARHHFFNEPTAALDPIMGDVINNLNTECVRDLGATTLTISHDMSSARTIVDRVAMLYEGEIIWTGGVDQIDHCSNELVDQFIHRREHGPFALEVA